MAWSCGSISFFFCGKRSSELRRRSLCFKFTGKKVLDNMQITVEFGGGAELLFDNKKIHDVSLPHKEKEWILGDLLIWLKDNLLKERPELFLQDKSVRPGILVLVNDADWELMDTVNYVIQPNDKIIFISTLHGG